MHEIPFSQLHRGRIVSVCGRYIGILTRKTAQIIEALQVTRPVIDIIPPGNDTSALGKRDCDAQYEIGDETARQDVLPGIRDQAGVSGRIGNLSAHSAPHMDRKYDSGQRHQYIYYKKYPSVCQHIQHEDQSAPYKRQHIA